VLKICSTGNDVAFLVGIAAHKVDLSREYGLGRIRRYLEVPLDKDVAGGLKGKDEAEVLPKGWPGIKRLDKEASGEFQDVAKKVAKRLEVDRVDVDVYWRQ